MPYTPYHFGLNGFVGLLFRRRLDVPMMLLANVLLDLEVLAASRFSTDWRPHQFVHLHTLLVGGAAGALMGAFFYWLKPLRRLCEAGMAILGLPYRAKLGSMTAGGLLGAWLHVLVDGVYHYDVQPFWPYPHNPFLRWIGRPFWLYRSELQQYVRAFCLFFWGLLIALYAFLLLRKLVKAWRQPA